MSGRTKGSKNRFSTRTWIDEQLKKRNIDAIKESVEMFTNAEQESTRLKVLDMWWERLYPKARPEDLDGNTEEGAIITNTSFSIEQIQEMIKAARKS